MLRRVWRNEDFSQALYDCLACAWRLLGSSIIKRNKKGPVDGVNQACLPEEYGVRISLGCGDGSITEATETLTYQRSYMPFVFGKYSSMSLEKVGLKP